LSFNGNNSLVRAVNNNGDLDDLEKGSGMTAMAWINPTTSGVGGAGRIIDKENNTGGWFLSMKGTNQIQFVGAEFTSAAMVVVSSATVTLGSWNHVAVTWDGNADGTNCNIYINGVLSGTTIVAGSGVSGSDAGINFVIGNRDIADRGFAGGIEEVAVWSRILSNSEILAFRIPGSTPTPTPSPSVSPSSTRSLTPTPSASPSSISNGPVAYWKFDEGSGTTVEDYTIYGNTATLVNTPVWGVGQIGNALNFSKNTAVVTANGDGVLANLHASGMSLACWIYPRSSGAGSAGRIVDKDNSLGGWFFSMKNTSQLQFVGDEFATATMVVVSTISLTLNAWSHVAVTWDGNPNGTNCKIYINGVLSGTTITAGSGNPDSDIGVPFCIGNRTQDNARGFDGYIDEMYVYNKVIPQTQVQSVMNAPPAVSSTPGAVSATPSRTPTTTPVTPTPSLSIGVSPPPVTPSASPTSSQTRTPTISVTPSISSSRAVSQSSIVWIPGHIARTGSGNSSGMGGQLATVLSFIQKVIAADINNQFVGFCVPAHWADLEGPTADVYDGSWGGSNSANVGFAGIQRIIDLLKSYPFKRYLMISLNQTGNGAGASTNTNFPANFAPAYLGVGGSGNIYEGGCEWGGRSGYAGYPNTNTTLWNVKTALRVAAMVKAYYDHFGSYDLVTGNGIYMWELTNEISLRAPGDPSPVSKLSNPALVDAITNGYATIRQTCPKLMLSMRPTFVHPETAAGYGAICQAMFNAKICMANEDGSNNFLGTNPHVSWCDQAYAAQGIGVGLTDYTKLNTWTHIFNVENAELGKKARRYMPSRLRMWDPAIIYDTPTASYQRDHPLGGANYLKSSHIIWFAKIYWVLDI
jgi:hypothetical protein